MKISVSSLQPQAKFSKPLSFLGGDMVLPEQCELLEADIRLLKKWGIKNVFLSEDDMGESVSSSNRTVDKTGVYTAYLKDKKEFEKIQNLFLVPLRQFYEDARSRTMGSFEFFTKSMERFLEMLLLNQEAFLLNTMIHLGKSRMQYSFTKSSFFVGLLSMVIGRSIKLPRSKLKFLFECALIADIGMLKVPLRVILKYRKDMTEQEFRLIQSHPLIGYKMMMDGKKLSKMHALVILLHHERVDGTGIPKQLTGPQIPLYSKIIGLCQSFVSASLGRGMESEQPRMGPYDIMQRIYAHADKQFDKVLCNCLSLLLSAYPVSSLVTLSNGQIGMVIAANPSYLNRPIVKALFDERGRLLREGSLFDTSSGKVSIEDTIYDERLTKKALENL